MINFPDKPRGEPTTHEKRQKPTENFRKGTDICSKRCSANASGMMAKCALLVSLLPYLYGVIGWLHTDAAFFFVGRPCANLHISCCPIVQNQKAMCKMFDYLGISYQSKTKLDNSGMI